MSDELPGASAQALAKLMAIANIAKITESRCSRSALRVAFATLASLRLCENPGRVRRASRKGAKTLSTTRLNSFEGRRAGTVPARILSEHSTYLWQSSQRFF